MKAKSLWHTGPQKLEIREINVAEPGPYQVLARVTACGICTWDLHIFNGGHPASRPYPFYFGHEGVGIVEKLGPGVSRVAVGDRVALRESAVIGAEGTGHMAEYALQPEAAVVPLPADGRPDEHWMIEPVACCVNSANLAPVHAGARIALVGCGFMGSIILQLLALSPVGSVEVFDQKQASLQYARSVGGSAPVAVHDLGEKRDLSDLHGTFDMVIETAGVEPAFLLSNSLVRKGGTFVVFSAQRRPFTFNFSNWHSRGITVLNTTPAAAPDFGRCFSQSVPLMADGRVDVAPLVTHVAPPERAQALYEDGVSKQHGYIKGVIRWG